ncbi:hypothetical protein SAMN02745857_04265 [Andreprevotia lacus DSM 23236]|jgi:hypothetical protein|uniref:Fibronectin type-III domain-containing protein n=2 Tax=Andreprevotia TaxID=397275 RepID=A0A1W1Y1A5_9NEIS|nr:hypothetical protein SAMN02745857_04265 [Andreprevotia lacus DSM 23236]
MLRRFAILFAALLTLTSPWACSAVTYGVAVSRHGQNFYTIEGSNVVLQTQFCYTAANSASATLTMNVFSSTQDGSITFTDDRSKCAVLGAYGPVQMGAGSTTANLAYLDNGLFIDTAQDLIVQADLQCSAIYNGQATLVLNSSGLSYRGGQTLGKIQFRPDNVVSSCGLAGIFKRTNLSNPAAPDAGPALSNVGVADVTANSVSLRATASQNTTVYWLLASPFAVAPTNKQIVAGVDGSGKAPLQKGSGSLQAGISSSFAIQKLLPLSDYQIFVATRNADGQMGMLSARTGFSTPSATQSSIGLSVPDISWAGSGRALMSATADQDATGYWMILPQQAPMPDITQVVAGVDASGAPAQLRGYGPMKANTPTSFWIANTPMANPINLYMVARNAAGQYSARQYSTNTLWPSNSTRPDVNPENGWWWNPDEGGRGFSIEINNTGNPIFDRVFFAGFMYDDSGRPIWYTASLSRSSGSGSFYGTLLSYTDGQSLDGAWRSPNSHVTGKVTLMMINTRQATLQIEIEGLRPISFNIERFPIVSNGLAQAPVSGSPQTGWWWNRNEGGRGYFIEVQGNTAFIASYMYDPDGKPVWYITQNSMASPNFYSGALVQYGYGQVLTGDYYSPAVTNPNVGNVILRFFNAKEGVLVLPNGISIDIERYIF